MTNIIKTTQGEAAFRLREEFVDELKIENIKYKLKEVLKDGNS